MDEEDTVHVQYNSGSASTGTHSTYYNPHQFGAEVSGLGQFQTGIAMNGDEQVLIIPEEEQRQSQSGYNGPGYSGQGDTDETRQRMNPNDQYDHHHQQQQQQMSVNEFGYSQPIYQGAQREQHVQQFNNGFSQPTEIVQHGTQQQIQYEHQHYVQNQPNPQAIESIPEPLYTHPPTHSINNVYDLLSLPELRMLQDVFVMEGYTDLNALFLLSEPQLRTMYSRLHARGLSMGIVLKQTQIDLINSRLRDERLRRLGKFHEQQAQDAAQGQRNQDGPRNMCCIMMGCGPESWRGMVLVAIQCILIGVVIMGVYLGLSTDSDENTSGTWNFILVLFVLFYVAGGILQLATLAHLISFNETSRHIATCGCCEGVCNDCCEGCDCDCGICNTLSNCCGFIKYKCSTLGDSCSCCACCSNLDCSCPDCDCSLPSCDCSCCPSCGDIGCVKGCIKIVCCQCKIQLA